MKNKINIFSITILIIFFRTFFLNYELTFMKLDEIEK